MSENSLGWGKGSRSNVEIWDAQPVFLADKVRVIDWLKLLFYPKKFFLYNFLKKNLESGILNLEYRDPNSKFQIPNSIKILDVGCGTGATLVDLKKMFGDKAEVIGVDVIKEQIDLANKKISQHKVETKVQWYDGETLPFVDNYFDAIYTSDVLGHVIDVPKWLKELNRVLKPGGTLAMFAESKLGKHAYMRNYLLKNGLNVDPHQQFHISLYRKDELKKMLIESGFELEKMFGLFWASFLVHPDEFYSALHQSKKFPILRRINFVLYWLKKITYPFSYAVAELYGLAEAILIGRWLESQGYIVLGKKNCDT